MRHLFTLALGGLLGVCLLASDAEACHKKKCGGGCGGGQVVCAQPVAYASCGHKAKKCGGGCHKQRKTCAAPVMACNTGYAYGGGYAYSGYSYGAPMASGQTYAAPQATGQSYGTPQVPSKR